MSATDRSTVTRRHALRTGGLAAIMAGLLGATTTPPAAAAGPLTVGTVSNVADIAAECERFWASVREYDHAVAETERALLTTLNAEQQALFCAYENADADRDFEQMDLYVAEIGRHMPGLYPTLWALWRHVIEAHDRRCCEAEPSEATS